MNPGEIRTNLQQGILEFDDGTATRGVLPTISLRDVPSVLGDGTNDDTVGIRAALAAIPPQGGRLVIPYSRSYYKTTDVIIVDRSNVEIQMEPGSFIRKDSSTNINAVFRFIGRTPGTFTNITADPPANAITVTVASTAGLAVGDWIEIRDDEPPDTGSTGVHHEINRIRSIVSTTVEVYYPLADAYATWSAVAPRLRRIEPVISSGIVGRGKIQNGEGTTSGNAGVDFNVCVGGYARGVEFESIYEDAVRYQDGMSGIIKDCYMHDNSIFFDGSAGRGRGISSRGSTHLIVENNHINRSRHAVDITFFSRFALVRGNQCRGSALAHLKAHPDAKHVWFDNNIIDAGYGYASGVTGEFGTAVEAVGISIDNNTSHVQVTNNLIANIRNDGVRIIPETTHNITIKGNKFKNCNTTGNTSLVAAIRVQQEATTGSSVNNPGYVIESNVIEGCAGRGIVVGMSGAVIKNNTVREIRAASGSNRAGIMVAAHDPTTPAVEEVLNVRVIGNTVEGCDGHGILVGTSDAKCRGTVVKDNTVRDCGLSGIQASPQFNGSITIEDNNVTNVNNVGNGDNTMGGINVYSASSTAGAVDEDGEKIIKNNTLWGVMRLGVQCNASRAVIKSNVTHHITSTTGSLGIGIHVPVPGGSNTTADIIIEDNTTSDCDQDGIRVGAASGQGVTGTRIIDNTAHDNAGRGINVLNTSTSAVLDGNFAKGNGTADYQDLGTTTVLGANFVGANNRIGVGTIAPDSPVHVTGKIHGGAELELDGDLNHDGTNIGLHGATPVAQSTGWSITNETTDKVMDADSTSQDEMADVLGTLIETFKTRGDLGS